jgi:hypothetical protein
MALYQVGGRLEGVEAGVDGYARHLAHVLYVHPVHLVDLADHQVQQVGPGQLDDELVYGPARAALEDLHAHQVTAHGADPAGHGTERAGPVRHPHADHVARHIGYSRWPT